MKKIFFLVVACLFLLTSCAQAIDLASPSDTETPPAETAAPPKVDIDIGDSMFIAKVNDVYTNADDYMGQTIKLAGVFCVAEGETRNYYSVIRFGPGCCGNDGDVGFEVQWDGEYPNSDDWVEVVGTLATYAEDDINYLYLRLSSLTVLPERGEEYVNQ